MGNPSPDRQAGIMATSRWSPVRDRGSHTNHLGLLLALSSITATPCCSRVDRAAVYSAAENLRRIATFQKQHFQEYGFYVDSTANSACTIEDSDLVVPGGTDSSLPTSPERARSSEKAVELVMQHLRPEPGGGNRFGYATAGWAPGKRCLPAANRVREPSNRWWFAEARSGPDVDGVSTVLIWSSDGPVFDIEQACVRELSLCRVAGTERLPLVRCILAAVLVAAALGIGGLNCVRHSRRKPLLPLVGGVAAGLALYAALPERLLWCACVPILLDPAFIYYLGRRLSALAWWADPSE
jgi:hypothetical protein